MDFSTHTEQQLMDRLTQLAAKHAQYASESNGAQTADLNEATLIMGELNDRFDRYVAIREQPAGSGQWAVDL